MRALLTTVCITIGLGGVGAQDQVLGQIESSRVQPLAEYQAEVARLRIQAMEHRKRIEATFDAEVVKLKQKYSERIEALRLAAMGADDLNAAIKYRDLKSELEQLASPLNFQEDQLGNPEENLGGNEPIKKQSIGPTFYAWKHGQPPVKMIHSSEGFCFLTHINGINNPDAELAELTIADDGYWYLQGRTRGNQGFLFLRACAVSFDQFSGVTAKASGANLPM